MLDRFIRAWNEAPPVVTEAAIRSLADALEEVVRNVPQARKVILMPFAEGAEGATEELRQRLTKFVGQTIPSTKEIRTLPVEILRRGPQLPAVKELLPKVEEMLPSFDELRESAVKMAPAPKQLADAVLQTVSPMERVRLGLAAAVPVSILVGAGIVALVLIIK